MSDGEPGPVFPDVPCLRPCDCGESHLLDPVTALCTDVLGPTVTMVTGNGAWEVPRVYAAWHRPETGEVELLAAVYGWDPWTPG